MKRNLNCGKCPHPSPDYTDVTFANKDNENEQGHRVVLYNEIERTNDELTRNKVPKSKKRRDKKRNEKKKRKEERERQKTEISNITQDIIGENRKIKRKKK